METLPEAVTEFHMSVLGRKMSGSLSENGSPKISISGDSEGVARVISIDENRFWKCVRDRIYAKTK